MRALVERSLSLSESGNFDAALVVFAQIRQSVSADDTALLTEAVCSPRANFWVREMLAESLAAVGGVDALGVLVAAHHSGSEEGHDNDSLSTVLMDLVERNPLEASQLLHGLRSNEHLVETVDWLLEFCE